MNKKNIYLLIIVGICLFIISCKEHKRPKSNTLIEQIPAKTKIDSTSIKESFPITKPLSVELRLIDAGLKKINQYDSTIVIDLKYSTDSNFMKKDVYGDFNQAYLQPDVLHKLIIAQSYLKEKHPFFNLIVFDAVRPMNIQQLMWNILDMPVTEKTKYLSNPRKGGSLHNYGAAIDLSIVNENGKELDMGTPFDYFGELAYPIKEPDLLKEGKLTTTQVNNRKLLREVMYKAGFFNIQTEWWHFNSCTREEAILKYKLVE